MSARFIFIAVSLLLVCTTKAQTDEKPAKPFKNYIREENGKKGLLHYESSGTKIWYVEPAYNKITAVSFGYGEPLYYKFWKGDIFDIVRFEILPQGAQVAKIAEDVSELVFPFAYDKDFFTYKSKGKWGCFLNQHQLTTVPAKYDVPPTLMKDPFNISKYIVVQSNGLSGLLNSGGYIMVEPGAYNGFEYVQMDFIKILGKNNLIGYATNSYFVEPLYVSVEYLSANSFSTAYYIGQLPDSSYEVRKGMKLMTINELITDAAVPANARLKEILKTTSSKVIILGNMAVEVGIDKRGTISSIGNRTKNEMFTDYLYDSAKRMARFTINGDQVFYYESGNTAIKCPASFSSKNKFLAMNYSNTPWPGETGASPEILADSSGKLVVINALTGKRLAIPGNCHNDTIMYTDVPYQLLSFESYDNIVFFAKPQTCSYCSGKGYTTLQEQQKVEIPASTKTTYKSVSSYKETNERTWDPSTNSYKWVKSRTPVTEQVAEQTKVPARTEIKTVTKKIPCTHCDKKGKLFPEEFIWWNGSRFNAKR